MSTVETKVPADSPDGMDMTVAEQTNVRKALRFLRAQFGNWKTLGQVLRFKATTLSGIATGARSVSPMLTFRLARLAEKPVDDLLAGRYPPPGVCPHCGRMA